LLTKHWSADPVRHQSIAGRSDRLKGEIVMRIPFRLMHRSLALAAAIVATLSVAAASDNVGGAAQGSRPVTEAMASAATPSKAARTLAPRRAVARSGGTCSGIWCGRHFVLMLGVAY
jgi:hypothetical protein